MRVGVIMTRVLVKGAGVGGLCAAHELATRGAKVTLIEKQESIEHSASWLAGGMLAPWCERESAEEPVVSLGKHAANWWDAALPGHVIRAGTLVVAPPRDTSELGRFAARTSNYSNVDEDRIAELEPDLAGRFRKGLHFAEEAHLDPRAALKGLWQKIIDLGGDCRLGERSAPSGGFDVEIDCTGMDYSDPDLRGVRGEMLVLRTGDVSLSRTVRLLHPRIPIYIVPRSDQHFMVGGTMIETDDDGPVSVRSVMELLNACYALHPAFAEAQIVEIGTGVRPAWPDNLPRVKKNGRTISINGFYRHGYLLAPAMARQAADLVFGQTASKESKRETSGKRAAAAG